MMTLYQTIVPPSHDPHLVAFFGFDEGIGNSTTSSLSSSNMVAYATSTDSMAVSSMDSSSSDSSRTALLRWQVSGVPSGSKQTTRQGYPVAVVLTSYRQQTTTVSTIINTTTICNSSAAGTVMYQVTEMPKYGLLYRTRQDVVITTSTAMTNSPSMFPALSTEQIQQGDLIILPSSASQLIYVPFANYYGSDHFAYQSVYGDGLISVNQAVIQIDVTAEIQIRPLELIAPTIVLEPFQIWDNGNGWDVNVPLTTTVDVSSSTTPATAATVLTDGSMIFDPATVTLATTRDLYFSEQGGQGKGVSDRVTTFNAMNDRVVSDAVSSLEISMGAQKVAKSAMGFTLNVSVSDNDPVTVGTAFKAYPVSVHFSSVPQIVQLYPTVFTAGEHNVLGINMALDVYGGVVFGEVSCQPYPFFNLPIKHSIDTSSSCTLSIFLLLFLLGCDHLFRHDNDINDVGIFWYHSTFNFTTIEVFVTSIIGRRTVSVGRIL